MRDDLSLPPRRPLPPVVRDRMRATVQDGMRPSVRRVRPPLAVAAGVAVLALGVTLAGQSLVGSHGNPTANRPATPVADGTPPPLDWRAAQAQMDRCWAAVVRADKAAGVPARSTWQAVFAVPADTFTGITVTAVRAGGKPLICETTRTTVTVSDPNGALTYASGTKTAALLVSADGVYAGVMDPRWTKMESVEASKGNLGSGGGPGLFAGGMFVDFSEYAPAYARYTVRQTGPGRAPHPELDLPPAPAALVAMVDRPDPPPDRTSAAGKFLGECIANSWAPVVDPASWQPVVLAGAAPNRFVLARSGDRMATCTAASDSPGYRFLPALRPLTPNRPIQYSYGVSYATNPSGKYQSLLFFGLLRSDVATVEIIAPDSTPRSVDVVHGTFSAEFAGQTWVAIPRFTAVLRDKSGRELYRGRIETDFG